MATIIMWFFEIPVGTTPVPTVKMVVVNYDLYNLKQKRLSQISTEKEEIMWVCSDFLKEKR